ncbi:hypothetical protein ACFYXH_05245 [Streptomyces sp. NPDC002730]|uniref:hypothetical protein n=1 Tax=Streptomyces sp. NPDC002730 TaxID=3364662 RepID=UPI0036933E90
MSGTDAAVFQAKTLKRFTRRDLEKAVDRFVRGKRPFGASRFVVVTTHDADRTEIGDRLFEIRREHPDLKKAYKHFPDLPDHALDWQPPADTWPPARSGNAPARSPSPNGWPMS